MSISFPSVRDFSHGGVVEFRTAEEGCGFGVVGKWLAAGFPEPSGKKYVRCFPDGNY